jgi:hypothetical protein
MPPPATRPEAKIDATRSGCGYSIDEFGADAARGFQIESLSGI